MERWWWGAPNHNSSYIILSNGCHFPPAPWTNLPLHSLLFLLFITLYLTLTQGPHALHLGSVDPGGWAISSLGLDSLLKTIQPQKAICYLCGCYHWPICNGHYEKNMGEITIIHPQHWKTNSKIMLSIWGVYRLLNISWIYIVALGHNRQNTAAVFLLPGEMNRALDF